MLNANKNFSHSSSQKVFIAISAVVLHQRDHFRAKNIENIDITGILFRYQYSIFFSIWQQPMLMSMLLPRAPVDLFVLSFVLPRAYVDSEN